MAQNHIHTWASALQSQNLTELFHERANSSSLFATGDDGRNFTRADFWSIAGRMASTLTAAGAKPGDRIAVQVEKSIEALALFWACVRGGFIFLPLNTAYTPSEISYFLNDAEAFAFVADPKKQIDTSAKIFTLDDTGHGSILDGNENFGNVPATWDTIAAILYTSGTTGRSKGAMLTHANLASNALALIDIWKFTTDDVLLHALPVYHTHGLFVGMNTVLFSGGQLLFHRKFNPDAVMNDLHKATTFMGVPTFYTRLMPHVTLDNTKHMRLFVSGSAPLLAETHKDFETRTGHAILERYGMTETNMIASNPYNGARRAGTVGFPLPHVEVQIQDGMIEVRGPNVFQGYWRNPEKTREDKRDNGFFITGDLGHIDEQGYLVISGRAKDLIITGGFNVYPKEIEEVIDVIPGVIESAVIGLTHKDFGEAVTAVVATPGKLDENHIITELKTKLAAFKVPKRIVFVTDLPRNAMGKVQKAELRKTHAALYLP
jgi:malonyl-CoA/methylmalonyl-CoA synthetase